MENYFPKDSYRTLHNYTFKEATKYDNRNVCQVLYIFLLAKQILFHTFLEKSPLVPFQAKLGLLIFMFSFDLTLNACFIPTVTFPRNIKPQKIYYLSQYQIIL